MSATRRAFGVAVEIVEGARLSLLGALCERLALCLLCLRHKLAKVGIYADVRLAIAWYDVGRSGAL